MALDDLLSAVDEMSDQQKRGERLALSITGAYGGDPDDEATKRRLEKRTGIPSALMDEKVRKDAELQDFVSHPKLQTLPAHSPRTSTYLSSHENASISHDDVEALSGIERAFQVLKRSGRSFAASSASFSAGLWGIPRAAADILHAGTKPLTDLAGLPDYTGDLAEWTSNQQRGAEALAGKIRGSQEGATIFERGLYSGVESLGQNLLMLPITIASGGSATPMLVGMAGSTGGQAFGQAREEGQGVAQSLSFAASQGSIEYATERIPALRFVEGLQANRTLEKMFKSVLGPDIYGEQIATALQDLNEWAILRPEATLKDYLVERPSAAMETFIATVVGTGGQVAAAKGLQKAGQKVDNYIQAKSQSDFLVSLGDSVKASKTFARLPENVQALVKSIKEDGDVTDIYVPVDDFNKLFQGAKETPMEAATRILSDPARYTDAMVTGSDVAIPVEEFAMLAGSPQYSELARVSRTSPDAMSLAEAEAFEADREGRVNELLRMAEEEAPEDGETAQTAYKKIYDDAYGQLLPIRGHAEAEAGAALRAKGLTTISQRYGLDTDDLLARFPLTITRGPFPEAIQKQLSFDEQKAQAQLDAMIDRLRKRDIPKEQDIFGPTLAEFLVGKGGLKDQGGELKAMDAAKQRKPFKRSLVQAEGLGFDHARELAVEAGYLQEGADVRDLLDAIDAEFKGNPIYAPGGVNTRMLDEQEALKQFQEYLDMAGIDLAQATNEDVRKVLDQQMSRALFQTIDEYGGYHRPPGPTDGAPLYDLTGGGNIYPDDIYSANGLRYYGTGEDKADRESMAIINATKGKPNATVTIYRAVPKVMSNLERLVQIKKQMAAYLKRGSLPGDAFTTNGNKWYEWAYEERERLSSLPDEPAEKIKINPGDWVTLSRTYAKNHGESTLYGNYEIITKKVKAKDIFTNGDSINEFGYWPEGTSRALFQSRRGSAEGHEALSVRKTQAEGMLLTAVMANGIIKVAGIGATHYDVHQEIKATSEGITDANGFVTPDNKFLDRKQALAWLKENRTEVYKQLNKVTKTNGLESQDYAHAEGVTTDTDKLMNAFMARTFGISPQMLFQSEANQVVKLQDIIASLQKQFPEMKLDAFERKGEITINRIVFPKEQRGKGQGSEVFKAITEYADATGQIVTATPSTDFGGTKSRIIAFNKRFGFVENKGKNKDFAISETMYRLPVRALFQGFDDKRAYFDPLLGEIGLLKKADASSFVHELGHYYFEVLDALAKGDNAPEQIKSDMETLFKWFGVENREQMEVEHYEIFARGFEAYLYEGKAPSPELLGVFQRFKVWMKAVYASLRSLNVELTKDVRDVFDRLLATDDEIESAREDAGASPIFATAEAAGMKDEQFKAYRKLAEQAHLEARDRLDRQKLKEVTRAKEAWWKVARANMMIEVETEAKQEPAYQVLTFIYTGKLLDGRTMDVHRLSGPALAEMYDAPTLAAIRKKLGNIYVNEGGVDPDALADEFDFSSGDEMIKRIMEVPRFREYVSAETDRRMLERYGAMNPVEIAEEAAAAVHNDEQGRLLRAELKALRRKAKEVAPFVKAEKAAAQAARKEVKATIPPVEFFKEAAQRKIASMSLAELTPGIYARAEAKASREAFELNGKGKFVEAGESKQRQLLNHYLFKAAVEAKEEAEKIRKFFKKMETPKAQAVLGKAGEEFQTSMNAILEQYEFRKTTKKELDYRASLPGLVERMKELGRDTEPLESLLMSFKTNYRAMTLAELRDVADAGNFIYHAAKTAEKVRLGEKAVAKDLIRGEVIGSLRANSKGIKAVMESDHGWKKVLKFGRGFIAPSYNADTILFGLDGWERLGPVYRHVKGIIDDSVSNTLMPMQAKNGEAIEKLYSVYSGKELRKMFTARFKVPELDGSFTKEEILSIALNQGNEGNKEALVGSALAEQIGLTQEKIAAVLGRHMDERDWKFVQSVWDHVNSFWPEIAEKQRQRTGIVPQKVEATPVVTPFGLMRGGYYPLKFDMSKSINAAEDSAEEFYTSVRNGRFSWAQTSHGHTIERVGSGGRPVLLSLSVLHNHLNQVITDLSLGDAVNYSAFVLNDIQIKTAFEQAGAVEARQYLDIWLSDTAMQERVAGDVFTRTFRRLRTGIAAKSMLFNVGVGLLQVSGIFQTAGTIGINNTLDGVQELLSKPWTGRNNVVDQIYALSPFMAKRDDTFQKDMMDFISSVKSNSARNFVSNYGMWLIKRAQRIVDLATWMGAYKDGLRRYRQEPTDSRAIAYADRMVARAQGSGLFSDRSALERGSLGVDVRQSELVRGFTTLLSYQIAKFNVAREKVGKTDFTDLIQVSELAVDFTLLYVVDAAFTMMLTGVFPGDDEDESWLWKLGKRSASSALAAIPAMRDILAYFEGFNGGGVVGTFGDSLAKAWKQIEQGEIDKPLLKSVNTVGGILFKYPSAAINRFGDALSRDLDGQDVEMIEYFIYQDKGRK